MVIQCWPHLGVIQNLHWPIFWAFLTTYLPMSVEVVRSVFEIVAFFLQTSPETALLTCACVRKLSSQPSCLYSRRAQRQYLCRAGAVHHGAERGRHGSMPTARQPILEIFQFSILQDFWCNNTSIQVTSTTKTKKTYSVTKYLPKSTHTITYLYHFFLPS